MSITNTVETINSSLTEERIAKSFSSETSTLSNVFNLPTKIVRSDLTSTSTEKSEHIDYTKIIPADRIYPHIFDESTDAGSMLGFVRIALSDAEFALQSFAAPDLQAD